ncbi:MAG: endo-1,4-beta-xylanase [Verrucomicrobia bacterium]|nr:endo-1,4-beta-xylanase [Verrucomicrobiota bacterium]MCH8529168.1 endo-1,4-beta-xylanase [Kiritimatiellia bacterium]
MTLKNAFKDRFYIGTAFSDRIFHEEGGATRKLIEEQFNTVTAEGAMKWRGFQPELDRYNFVTADNFVEFGTRNDMYVVGHVLFWQNAVPDWVFQDGEGEQISREQLLERMRERVRVVAERYGSNIHAWDVVNEAFVRGELEDTNWTRIIGDDFIEQAFRIAQEELPEDVELIYNDNNMMNARQRAAVVEMIKDLQGKGIRIDGVGMQGHWWMNRPTIDQIEESIVAFAETGVKVHITELDIDVLPRDSRVWDGRADVRLKLQQDPALNPYRDGLPDTVQDELTQRYADIFALFLKHHDKIRRVTFWGPHDGQTWLNNWPIRGRTNHPLLFDRDLNPKPAFHAVMRVAKE